MDYVRAFKDMYFLVQPVLEGVITSLLNRCIFYGSNGKLLLNKVGEVRRKLVQMFNFHWDMEHFKRGTNRYIIKSGHLYAED